MTNNRVAMVLAENFVNDSRVMREARTLAAHGYELTIFALHDEGLKTAECIDGYQVKRVQLFTRARLSRRNKWIQTLKYLEFNLRIISILWQYKPVLCHCHNPNPLLGCYLAARLYPMRLLYDSHELWSDVEHKSAYPPILFWISQQIERFFVRRMDAVVTVSESIAATMSRNYDIPPPRLVRNVSDLEQFPVTNILRADLGLVDDPRLLVLFQGGISNNRGLTALVTAMGAVDNTVLVFLGNGWLKETLINLAQSLGIADRVYFHAAVPPAEVNLYTASADIGVHSIENTCLNHDYCLPNKFFSYLMAGLPVAVSDLREMGKIVRDYGVGELFDPTDPMDIAAKLCRLVDDKEYYATCKRHTARVNADFNWQVEEQTLQKIYRELLTT